MDIQKSVGNLTFEGGVRLSVKIGFGLGHVKIIYVGGILGRAEYLPVGEPLSHAFEAEHLAEGGGVIIVPKMIKQMLDGYFRFEKIKKDGSLQSKNGPFYYVKDQIGAQLMVKAGAALIRSKLSRNELIFLKNKVNFFEFFPFFFLKIIF